MKNLLKIFAIATILFSLSAGSYAQVTGSAGASATVVTPISITKEVDMEFGNLAVQPLTGGTCVMLPNGSRTATAGVTLPVVTGGPTAASFTVTGMPTYTYSIILPSTPLTITRQTGTETMAISLFTSSPTPTGVIGAGGTQTLTVGATVTVNAGQVAGHYVAGTPFNVTVNYN